MVANALLGGLAAGAIQGIGSIGAADAARRAGRRQQRFAMEQTPPYRDTGQNALAALAASYGIGDGTYDYTMSPAAQFQMGQGVEAIEGSAVGGSGLYSGATMRRLGEFGQQFANNYLNSERAGLAQLAGMGQNATNTALGYAMPAMQQVGQGNIARAVAPVNALSQGLNTGFMIDGYLTERGNAG